MNQRCTGVVSKQCLLRDLPLHAPPLRIRRCSRIDLESLAAWPEYSEPFQHFRFSFTVLTPSERDVLFEQRENQTDRISLVVDHDDTCAIGYIALLEIDWAGAKVENMSVRLHPEWCGRGIGSVMIGRVVEWCIRSGLRSLKLDVAAANQRAVRCYQNAGFEITSEFWRKDEGVREDLNRATPVTRFWWMERISRQ